MVNTATTSLDPFTVWSQMHPEASRRDTWNAAIDAAYELTDHICDEKCGGPLRAILALRSRTRFSNLEGL